MKTCEEIEHDNLVKLIEESGSQNQLAILYECQPNYISQLMNQTVDKRTGTTKGMGPSVKRKLENVMGKERGWMDHDHSNPFSRGLGDDQKIILAGFALLDDETKKDWLDAAQRRIDAALAREKPAA